MRIRPSGYKPWQILVILQIDEKKKSFFISHNEPGFESKIPDISRVQTQAVLPRVRSEEGSEEACSEERSEKGLSSARLNRGRVKLL